MKSMMVALDVERFCPLCNETKASAALIFKTDGEPATIQDLWVAYMANPASFAQDFMPKRTDIDDLVTHHSSLSLSLSLF